VQLRPYQERAISHDLPAAFKRSKAVVYVAPTGSGKSTSVAEMVRRALARGRRVLFLVHRYRLVRQLTAILPFTPDVAVMMVQSACRRLDDIRAFAPDLIVTDECHRSTSSSYRKVYDILPDAWHLGLTATPCRTDGTGLGEVYGEMVLGPSMRELIKAGHLADYVLFRPKNPPNFKGVRKQAGDYSASAGAAVADKATITGDAIGEYRKRCDGARAVAFCFNVAHAEHVAEQFNEAGIAAAHVSGRMGEDEQNAKLDAFERGELRVLANVALIEEGVDVPAIDVVIWLRRTQSVRVWMQGCGRALRPQPGKRAVIIDHCDNALGEGLGLPCEQREWSLEGKHKATGRTGSETLRWCEKCFAASPAGSTECIACGEPFERRERTIEHVDGELEEVDRAEVERLRGMRYREVVGEISSIDDVKRIAQARGYRPAWAVRRVMDQFDMAADDACVALGYKPGLAYKLGLAS
jgi:superfamily II DNA or RNA helicase